MNVKIDLKIQHQIHITDIGLQNTKNQAKKQVQKFEDLTSNTHFQKRNTEYIPQN